MNRIVPFDLIFGALENDRFESLRTSIESGRIDPFDRDAFILDRAVTELLRDLVPDDAPPESLHEFIAVLQHCYLFWSGGANVITTKSTELPGKDPTARPPDRPAVYTQLPSHLYWGQLEPDGPHEPLDGFFVHPLHRRTGDIRALAIFGLHPERPGVSVAEVSGPAPTLGALRGDGTKRYAPLMEGGAAAGLRSIADDEELLALAWHSLSPEA